MTTNIELAHRWRGYAKKAVHNAAHHELIAQYFEDESCRIIARIQKKSTPVQKVKAV